MDNPRSDPFAEARTAARRLERLAQAEQEELARTPGEVRAKYDAKRQKIVGKLSPEARGALQGMGVIGDGKAE
jgi:hypothetical protein